MELNDLYRDVILDHNRRPRNFGALEAADASVEGFNPMCGDRLTLRLKLADDKISGHPLRGPGLRDIDRLGFADDRSGEGQDARAKRCDCSIACTSCSPTMRAAREELGKLAALSGVREYPGAGQMREPVLAHARLRPASRPTRSARACGDPPNELLSDAFLRK